MTEETKPEPKQMSSAEVGVTCFLLGIVLTLICGVGGLEFFQVSPKFVYQLQQQAVDRGHGEFIQSSTGKESFRWKLSKVTNSYFTRH